MVVVVSGGWRIGSLILLAVSLCMMAPIGFGMRDDPSEVGLEPYGSEIEGSLGSGKEASLARSSKPATAMSGQVSPPPVGIHHAVNS